MTCPKTKKKTRICIAVGKDGVTAYGNKEAFRSLAEWMNWIADSNPSEHYECHLKWHLKNRYFGKENVWILKERGLESIQVKDKEGNPAFELTFMAVEDKDLDELEKHKESGFLPDSWGKDKEK